MCSMILPGLSGSYVLVLMGNYACVLRAILTFDLAILLPFGLGAIIGLLLFARLLGWIFKHYHDQTIALLSGFIFGSLLTLWPWKTPILQTIMTDEQVRENNRLYICSSTPFCLYRTYTNLYAIRCLVGIYYRASGLKHLPLRRSKKLFSDHACEKPSITNRFYMTFLIGNIPRRYTH